MIFQVLPQTRTGRWSVLLIITMPVLIVIGSVFVNLYPETPPAGTIPKDLIARPGVAVPSLLGIASGIAALITGLIAVVKQKERALLVCISILIGLLLLYFLVGEIVFPH